VAVSSFSGLNLALSGLLAHQRALDVTGHNIANAGVAGYTRQEAVLAARAALEIPAGARQGGDGALLGQGVDVLELRRIRDSFIDLQVRAQNLALGGETAEAAALTRIEDGFQEPGDLGLSALLGKFWTSWQQLAANPESDAAKAAVAGYAKTLADGFNRLDAHLASVGADAAAEAAQLQGPDGPVTRIAAELGTLDRAIREAVGAGREPNDLLDRRDALLDQLSSLGQVSTTDLGGGSLRVSFGGAAAPLVDGSSVTWPQALSNPGGRIGALQDIATTTVPAYRALLDGVASAVASQVNAAHPTPIFTGATAASLTSVATAASVRATAGAAPGANDVAAAIAALRGGTGDTGYADLVRRVGSDAATANAGRATATAVLAQLEDRRAEVSGVSLDEEMTNMLRFQRGYQAAARAMTTMDEALDVLINRTGRVGL
jgi:flagellar hook-associated protein 1 FlgK